MEPRKKHTVRSKKIIFEPDTQPEDQAEKEHVSWWLLTISTNRTIETKKDPFFSTFVNTCQYISDNIPDYIRVLPGARPDNEMIISSTPSVEIGPKFHRLHAHFVIEARHSSKIQLDTKKISQFLALQNGGANMYVNSKYIRGSGELKKALDYAKKNSDKPLK